MRDRQQFCLSRRDNQCAGLMAMEQRYFTDAIAKAERHTFGQACAIGIDQQLAIEYYIEMLVGNARFEKVLAGGVFEVSCSSPKRKDVAKLHVRIRPH